MKICAFCTIQQVSQGYCAFRVQSSKSGLKEISPARQLTADWKKGKMPVVSSSEHWEKIIAMTLASGELDLIVWLRQPS